MAVPLRVLILEDEPADAELAVHALRQAGFEPDWTRVDTEEDYVRCLELSPDVILADHRLPQFDSVRALARLRERGLDVPFVIVSGAIAQDLAVGLMEQGAADFVLKDRLARLGPAVLRALERKRLRDEKRLAEQRLLASERRFRALIEHSSDGIVLLSPEAAILYASPSTARILGYVPEELAGRNAFDFVHPEDIASTRTQFEDLKQSPGIVVSAMFRMAHKDGSWRWVEMTGTNLLAEPDVQAIVINLRDVTERERALRELQEQTQLLQSILESMSEGVIVADRNERFLYLQRRRPTDVRTGGGRGTLPRVAPALSPVPAGRGDAVPGRPAPPGAGDPGRIDRRDGDPRPPLPGGRQPADAGQRPTDPGRDRGRGRRGDRLP